MAKAIAREEFDPKSYAFPECRDGHEWKFYDGAVDDATKVGYQTDKCKRCGTKRHSTININEKSKNFGLLIASRGYVYPEGYNVTGGLDRFDKGKLRGGVFLSRISKQ